MRLEPCDDDLLIEEAAIRFLRDHPVLAPEPGDTPMWKQFAEMGWTALPVPEWAGGLGGKASTVAILVEALGRGRDVSAYLATAVHAAGLLSRFSDDRAGQLLSEIASGDLFAVVLPPGCVETTGATLNGNAELVLGGDQANIFLVPGATGLIVVPADAPGLNVASVAAVDGRGYADVALSNVAADDVLVNQDISADLAWADDWLTTMLCADALGAIRALIDRTVSYTGTRVQFGRTLQSFQVIEHGIADMTIGVEQAQAALQLALAMMSERTCHRVRAVSAAKVTIGAIGRAVANASIQFHGAMGVTEELDVGAFAKRLLAFDVLGGTAGHHLARYAVRAKSGQATHLLDCAASAVDDSPNIALSNDHKSFRSEITAYLDEAMPSEIARAQQFTTTVYAEPDIAQPWQHILYKKGFSAPHWPKEFGGTGWDPVQRYIWAHETARRFAPFSSPLGLPLVGPVLMHYGTVEQQKRYLPPIVAGEELWCQGFSEPSAGSDLAGLSTRATRDGDEYVVNGTKMWTTHGHFAQFMAALVRTDRESKRRDGISFLIIDMASPGIEIRPIVTIGGDHEINQVFFDDVRVPASNIVGNEGQGWEIAKFLLEYERGGDIMTAGHRVLLEEIRVAALLNNCQSDAFWRAFSEISIEIDVLECLELRVFSGAAKHDAVPSILKLRASEIQQAVTELGIRCLGRNSLRWIAQRPLHEQPGIGNESAFVSRYLNSRANSIFGGAREIQKTIIAKTVM